MPILGFNYFEKTCIEFCQIEDISEYKHISDMADFLDFRLSPKMHLKIKFSWDSYQKILECVSGWRYCNVQFLCQ